MVEEWSKLEREIGHRSVIRQMRLIATEKSGAHSVEFQFGIIGSQ
jgi:hypothetical protein